MPLEVQADIFTPDADTCYLVGPEGTVWTQPALGEPFILAARTETERLAAAAFVGELLTLGLVPYGVPLGQRATVAMFGGSPIRECAWVPWAEAPAPVGDLGDDLPTEARAIRPPTIPNGA